MKYPVLIRVLHYYASMACCFLFAFYAVSGFLATHAETFIGDNRPQWQEQVLDLPEGGLEDDEQRAAFCKTIIADANEVSALEHDDFENWFLVRSAEQSVRCIVNDEQVDVRPLYAIDEAIPHDAMADWIAAQHGGHVANLDLDEEFARQRFDLESVWFQGEVLVHEQERLYELRQRPAHFIRAIVDLHRGKHASGFQIFLADLTAILLFFVIITGALIGIQIKKRRRLGLIGLACSVLLTAVLLIFR